MINIIYGTISGNTELVVKQVAQQLQQQARHQSELQRVELSSPEDLTKEQITVLACGTYGHGVLQDYFDHFIQQAENVDLTDHCYAVIALGDHKYDKEYNLEAAKVLETFVTERNGKLLLPALRINQSPIPQLERINDWTKKLIIAIEVMNKTP